MIEIDKQTITRDPLGTVRLQIRYAADTRAQALTAVPTVVEGLPWAGDRATPWQARDGRWLVDAVYEGVVSDPPPEFDYYEIRTEEREQKIESFEPRQALIEDYGATINEEGRLEFPPTLSAPPNRIGLPLTLDNRGSAAPERPNPLHGVTTYPVTASVAVWRLVRKRVPGSLAKQARTVIDRLPSGFDHAGRSEAWYVRPLQLRKVGNAWEIEWTAIEISEFPDAQTLALLQGRERKGRGAGQGLTTGPL